MLNENITILVNLDSLDSRSLMGIKETLSYLFSKVKKYSVIVSIKKAEVSLYEDLFKFLLWSLQKYHYLNIKLNFDDLETKGFFEKFYKYEPIYGKRLTSYFRLNVSVSKFDIYLKVRENSIIIKYPRLIKEM